MTSPGPAAPHGVVTAIEAAITAAIGRPIGPDENFFDAGLTSLALVRIHAESTRSLSAPPPVVAMFAHPNLRALRSHLLAGGGSADHSRVVSRPARRARRVRPRSEGGWT